LKNDASNYEKDIGSDIKLDIANRFWK